MFTITIYRDSSAFILSRLFVTFTKWCQVFCLLSCFLHYVIVAASVELITRQPCCLLCAINYVVVQVHFYLFNVFVIWMVLVVLVLVLVLVLVMMLPDIFAVHSSRFTTCKEHAMGSHVQTHAVHIFKQCTAPPLKNTFWIIDNFSTWTVIISIEFSFFFSLIIEASNFLSAPNYGAIFIVYSVLQLVFLVHLIHSRSLFLMKDADFNWYPSHRMFQKHLCEFRKLKYVWMFPYHPQSFPIWVRCLLIYYSFYHC